MTEFLTTTEARDQFSEAINRAAYGKERVILTRRGKLLVAVIPIEDVRLLEAIEDQRDLELAKQAREEIKREGTTSWEDVKGHLNLRNVE